MSQDGDADGDRRQPTAMSTGLPKYDALIASEEHVRSQLNEAVRLPIELVIRGIEALLTISGYHGLSPEGDPDLPDGTFHWWASERARQSPFSIRASEMKRNAIERAGPVDDATSGLASWRTDSSILTWLEAL